VRKIILTCDVCNKEVDKIYNNKEIYKSIDKSIMIPMSGDDCFYAKLDLRFEPLTTNNFDICEECILESIKKELFPEENIVSIPGYPIGYQVIATRDLKEGEIVTSTDIETPIDIETSKQ